MEKGRCGILRGEVGDVVEYFMVRRIGFIIKDYLVVRLVVSRLRREKG